MTSVRRETAWKRSEVFIRGLRISFLERGSSIPASAPPIILLHGLVSESTCYKRLLRRLPQDRRVIAVDLPGSGYSERPSPGQQSSCTTFADLAGLVVDLMAALRLDRPVLIGHSHGGAISLSVAARHPEHLRGLVLLCPAHPYSGVERKIIRFYLSAVGHAFAHLLPRLPDWLMLFVFRHMPGSRRTLEMTDIAPYLHTLRTPGTVDQILRMVECWNNDMHQLGSLMDENPIAAPVLMVWGERDVVVPAWSARRLSARLADGELVQLHGVGHLPNDESPNKAAAVIHDWLLHRAL
ncbi:Pimeloyl-ACP methyl ester carboxylesterase [Bryocella elongata]|uniref:Pimeloyl-ACP methyl ester carboxylesterase n=1 Tax=Bryocella elongata TaxID=863522 RepID=A0A1H5TV44_9BACT|nr:alpha/beta hydrolase [Bryocella elongata]SEF66666.1 Pimeloyl-ACP methyl ester carboxylesterase [Bryocella elongata]